MSKKEIQIRAIRKEDLSRLVELIALHATYERADYDPGGKETALGRDLFVMPKLHGLVAEVDRELVGYATYTFQYSTWDASEYVYMDCLFLSDSARGQGIGLSLMNRIKDEALAKSIELVQWQTPKFNEGAIRFYKRIGAKSLDKERFFWKLNA